MVWDWEAYGAISSSILTLALVFITIYYAMQTRIQAKAMKIQNGMIENNLKLDRLAKQHDRLVKEMTGLIGPLHSRKNEDDLFGPIMGNNRDKLTKKGYYPFWQGIEENLYLASSDLRRVLNEFIIFQKDYLGIRDSTSEEQAREELNERKEALLSVLDPRYTELVAEIQKIERELGWIK